MSVSATGSNWILLRGLTRESRHWGSFPALFAREIPGARTITLDLPGSGQWHDMKSPTGADALAEHCRTSLAARNIAPPYYLLAMSLGAMVATAWVRRWPGEVSGSVLINTSFANFSPLHHRLQTGNWGSLARLALSNDAATKERLIFAMTSRLPDMPPALLADWLAIRASRPVSSMNAFRQLLAAAKFRAPMAAPGGMKSAPLRTLLLASAGDQLVDARCTQAIAQRWRSPTALHPSAGHDLPLDDGLWVSARIRDWLAKTHFQI